MSTNTKKDKFYSVLKNIFIGAEIEGNSGYVNLMRIKNKYYQDFKGQLSKDIDKKLDEVGRNFEEELYNKLYTFFKKYFSESGSIYFSYTPLQEKVYERIYRDDKDVMLFWKTNMLYYVKTERLYQNMDFQDEDNLIWYHFDVSELEHKKNNEKKELIFEYDKSFFEDNKREIFFKVKYSKNGSKTKIEDILKKIKKSTLALSSYKEQELKRALGVFRKQSEVDYFINKNAKEFLREQFSIWIKTYVFDDDTIFKEARLKQLKALRDIAYNIIDLVSQFEDELVKIWNKPKFAHSSNYVITLDKIAEKDLDLLKKILASKGAEKQIYEWHKLGILTETFKIDDIFQKEEINEELFEEKNKSILNEKWQYLPLDTKYFKEFEFDILALFDDLDNQLDGWLIHSENYQALNTIKHKFYKKIDATYIDPPYNTDASSIIYINNYKNSSWLSLMENRLNLTKSLLNNKGIICVAIDDEQVSELRHIMKGLYHKEIGIVAVRSNPAGRKTKGKFAPAHEYALFYGQSDDAIPNSLALTDKRLARYPNKDRVGRFAWANFIRSGSNDKRSDRPKLFYPIFVDNYNTIRIPNLEWDDSKREYKLLEQPSKDEKIIYPVIEKGGNLIEKNWQRGHIRVTSELGEYRIRRVKDKISIDFKTRMDEDSLPITWWGKSEYASANHGALELKKLFGDKDFDFPKAKELVKDCIRVQSNNKNGIILDYFSGSGTSGHAVMELNREDNGRRKSILIELGEHFINVILPRMKKLSFSLDWDNGNAINSKSIGGFFKYYELEQYEETLRKAKYEDKGALPKDIYHQYIFFKDLKLANEVVKLDDESRSIKVDLTKLHNKIDIPETLSFLTGKFIKQILKDKVIFTDGSEIEYADIDYRIVKPLIWW